MYLGRIIQQYIYITYCFIKIKFIFKQTNVMYNIFVNFTTLLIQVNRSNINLDKLNYKYRVCLYQNRFDTIKEMIITNIKQLYCTIIVNAAAYYVKRFSNTYTKKIVVFYHYISLVDKNRKQFYGICQCVSTERKQNY